MMKMLKRNDYAMTGNKVNNNIKYFRKSYLI